MGVGSATRSALGRSGKGLTIDDIIGLYPHVLDIRKHGLDFARQPGPGVRVFLQGLDGVPKVLQTAVGESVHCRIDFGVNVHRSTLFLALLRYVLNFL